MLFDKVLYNYSSIYRLQYSSIAIQYSAFVQEAINNSEEKIIKKKLDNKEKIK